MNNEHHWYSTSVRIPLGVGQYNNKYSTKNVGHLSEGVQQSPSCSLSLRLGLREPSCSAAGGEAGTRVRAQVVALLAAQTHRLSAFSRCCYRPGPRMG